MSNVSTFGDLQYDVSIFGNQINSVKADGTAYGFFYGDTGNSAGGSFKHEINGDPHAVTGVYQVTTTTNLQ